MRLIREPKLTLAGNLRGSNATLFGKHSVLLADGADHLRQRRALLPAFQGTRLSTQRRAIVDATDRAIDSWPLRKEFSILGSLHRAALEGIVGAVFGTHAAVPPAEIGRHVEDFIGPLNNRGAFIALALALPDSVRTAISRRPLARRRQAMDAAILEEVQARRAKGNPPENSDVLSDLLIAAKDPGNGITTELICDEVRTLLLTGHGSTANSLAWAIAHLVENPASLDRLTTEVRSERGGRRYAEAAVSESLRLTPPLLGVQRKLTAPIETHGYLLPAQTLVAPCAYLIHRREDRYPNPDVFDPGRFLDREPDPGAWLPFGGGPRRCLGAPFARLQLHTMLERICERTRFRAPHQGYQEAGRRQGLSLAPAAGGRVILTERVAL
jgi:cytochrome P450